MHIPGSSTTCDDIGPLKLYQPVNGPRVNLDTFLLASWVKAGYHATILEAGCASGAISLLLALRYPGASITGIDIQAELIDLAQENADINALPVKFLCQDLRDFTGLYDVLVCNPPYSSSSSGHISPDTSRSISRHDGTLPPRDLAHSARSLLKSRGRLFTIFASSRLDVFLSAMRENRLIPKRLLPIYPKEGINSGIFLLECVKDGGEGMILLPAIYIRDKNNNYTKEIDHAYNIYTGEHIHSLQAP